MAARTSGCTPASHSETTSARPLTQTAEARSTSAGAIASVPAPACARWQAATSVCSWRGSVPRVRATWVAPRTWSPAAAADEKAAFRQHDSGCSGRQDSPPPLNVSRGTSARCMPRSHTRRAGTASSTNAMQDRYPPRAAATRSAGRSWGTRTDQSRSMTTPWRRAVAPRSREVRHARVIRRGSSSGAGPSEPAREPSAPTHPAVARSEPTAHPPSAPPSRSRYRRPLTLTPPSRSGTACRNEDAQRIAERVEWAA